MGLVKAAGGTTLAQDEGSCVVFGMPKAAIERNHVSRVVSLEAMASAIIGQCMQDQPTGSSHNGIATRAGR
jgi:chemotaxis response regulator CheB